MASNDSSTPASEIKPDGWMSRDALLDFIEYKVQARDDEMERITRVVDLWHERSEKRAAEAAALRAERDEERQIRLDLLDEVNGFNDVLVEVERMRPVVEAAAAWGSEPMYEGFGLSPAESALGDAVDAYRAASSEQETSERWVTCRYCDEEFDEVEGNPCRESSENCEAS